MAKVFDASDEKLVSWISAQPMWFVATAPLDADGTSFPQRFWSNHNCTGLNILGQPGHEVASIGFQAYGLGGQ